MAQGPTVDIAGTTQTEHSNTWNLLYHGGGGVGRESHALGDVTTWIVLSTSQKAARGRSAANPGCATAAGSSWGGGV